MGKNGSHRGFAGISGLVSDLSSLEGASPSPHTRAESEDNRGRVEPTLGKASSSDLSNRQSNNTSTASASHDNKSETRSESSQNRPTSTHQVDRAASKPKSTLPPGDQNKSGGGGKWLLVIAGAIFLIWAINQSDRPTNTTRSTPSSSYSPPPSIPSSNQPSGRPTYPGIDYQLPVVARDRVLSVAEIRWCTKEGIRIEAMRNVTDTQRGIDRFNQIVGDYNSRCGSFRYRSGNKSRAERDVEPYRSQIVSDAIREAKEYDNPYTPSYTAKPSAPKTVTPSYVARSTSPSKPTPSTKPSRDLTREAQQLLTDLGYKPGPIDGLFGRKTSDAIKAFQRNVGITVDGWVDQDLLIELRRNKNQRSTRSIPKSPERTTRQESHNRIPNNAHINYLGNDWECDNGYRKMRDGCQKVALPANAHINYLGNDWECDNGYRKMRDGCQKVALPANAHINYLGNDWECDNGYRKMRDGCQKVALPANAHINYLGNDWECDNGYRKMRDGCQKVALPANAHINYLGNDWECDRGYRKAGTRCTPVF
jgi:hypothetical protein